MAKRDVVHIEIPAKGRAKQAEFYAKMFGCEIQPMDESKYTLWQAGNVGGGFPDADDDLYKPGNVWVYFDSEDIEADLKKITSLGGKVLRAKTEIPGWGWYAMFADPTGNRMALFTGTQRD